MEDRRRRAPLRAVSPVAVVALVLLVASLVPSLPWAGASEPHSLAAGVTYRELRRTPRLAAEVLRLAPGSTHVRPVLAGDDVGAFGRFGGREATSAMCRRAGAVACVNGDFALCPVCGQVAGGIVVDGRVLRSPNPAHHQVTFTKDGPTTAPLRWGGRLVAEYVWWADLSPTLGPVDGEPRRVELRRERRELPLGGLNVGPLPNATVLFTPDWGGTTPSGAGHLEVVAGTAHPVVVGRTPADIGDQRLGPGPVPAGGVVLSANGEAAPALSRFADEWRRSDATERTLVIETALSLPAEHSVGGHPVLLREGRRQDWSRNDPKARGRHPRTLLGWTRGGELLLVAVDGRRPGHSAGVTLEEAADLLLELGAVEGINLDGGGSTTLVGPCADGPCVRNRPSDGHERLVPMALAVQADPRTVRPLGGSGAALPPPGAPPPDDPASTAFAPPPDPAPTAPEDSPEVPASSPAPSPAPADDPANDDLDALLALPPGWDPGPDRARQPVPGRRPAEGDATRSPLPAATAAVLIAGVTAAAVSTRRRSAR